MIAVQRFVSPLGLLLAGVVMVGTGTGCGGPKASSLNVPMTWKATERVDMSSVAGWSTDANIYVGAVTDKRTAKKELIGENLEDVDDGEPVRPIYPGGEVTDFVRDAFKTNLAEAGLHVVEDQASADRVITAELVRFWIEETGTYKAEVTANVVVTNKAGQQLWKGPNMTGTASKWGKSLSADNYRESMSDATLEMIENCLKNPMARKALEKTPAAGAATPAPAPAYAPTPTPAPPPPPAPAPEPAPAPGGAGTGNPLARPTTPPPPPAPGN